MVRWTLACRSLQLWGGLFPTLCSHVWYAAFLPVTQLRLLYCNYCAWKRVTTRWQQTNFGFDEKRKVQEGSCGGWGKPDILRCHFWQKKSLCIEDFTRSKLLKQWHVNICLSLKESVYLCLCLVWHGTLAFLLIINNFWWLRLPRSFDGDTSVDYSGEAVLFSRQDQGRNPSP